METFIKIEFKMWTKRIVIIVLAMGAAIFFHPLQAAAGTEIIFNRIVSDEMYELIRQSNTEDMDFIIEDHMEHYKFTRAEAITLIRKYELGTKEFDIDEDGTPELITVQFNSFYCGTAGCSSKIFEKIKGKWVLMGSGSQAFSPMVPKGTGRIFVTQIDDHRWHYYAPADPKFKPLLEKYGTNSKPGWWRGKRD